ncbi:MAG: HNH endonuclease, partial [Spirochaetales bacterium]|nr:HNH endonuclease [Spirochaetales bacterium]
PNNFKTVISTTNGTDRVTIIIGYIDYPENNIDPVITYDVPPGFQPPSDIRRDINKVIERQNKYDKDTHNILVDIGRNIHPALYLITIVSALSIFSPATLGEMMVAAYIEDAFCNVNDAATKWLGKNNETYTNRLIKASNPKRANKVINGVEHDILGFPIFDSLYDANIDPTQFELGDKAHKREAIKQLAEAIQNNEDIANRFTAEQKETIINLHKTPDEFRWHHHQTPGKLQLVDEGPHSAIGHTGGMFIWGGGR